MTLPSWYLLVPVLFPVLCGMLTMTVAGERLRNAFVTLALLLTAALVLPVLLSGDMSLRLFTLSDNLPVDLRTDMVSRFFAGLMSLVWLVAGIYSFEYMHHEEHLPRYYGFYLMTLGVLMGLCFAGGIVTYYMCYEFMTLLTVPLVMHTMQKDAVAAGVKYLIYSVTGASLVLLGIFILSPYVRSFEFAAGGVLDMEKVAGHEGTVLGAAFLMILGFGAKAGMFPLHGWLPTAHPAAPSPASAVLSGIITKAGVLGLVRVTLCFVGADFLRGTWVQTTFLSLALFTVFMGSLLAYREGLLKKRLAWSSVSQVSYVLCGLASLHPIGLAGALLHVVAHALIKDTLFMTAGAIISKTGKTHTKDLTGIGKQMPVTMWCFTLASVGLVGIPPCLGFISKWWLAQGALSMTGVPGFMGWLTPAVLLISALLTAGYLFPVTIRGFFPGQDEAGKPLFFEKKEPTCVMLVPMLLLTGMMLLLGMFPGMLNDLAAAIAGALL